MNMKDKKQTAVDWLADRIEEEVGIAESWEKIKQIAKEMEKEQIMEAHYAPKYGCFNDDYYNETYGGNK